MFILFYDAALWRNIKYVYRIKVFYVLIILYKYYTNSRPRLLK